MPKSEHPLLKYKWLRDYDQVLIEKLFPHVALGAANVTNGKSSVIYKMCDEGTLLWEMVVFFLYLFF